MKTVRILACALVFMLLLCALAPLGVFADGAADYGAPVVEDQGDYFFYGVLILSAAVFIGLGIFVFLRRRR